MDKQPNSRYCFLCGRDNPVGLRMTWYNDRPENKVWSKLVVPDEYNSYPGIVHGGIVAALLDETAGRAVLMDGEIDRLMVTARLNIRYRKPTPTGTELTVIGWIDRDGHSRARVAGEIRLADGTVTAECEALIIKPPAEYLEKFEAGDWYVDPD
ncbi:MAG: PaaI family thioesterase [Methylocystaceae bacterium]